MEPCRATAVGHTSDAGSGRVSIWNRIGYTLRWAAFKILLAMLVSYTLDRGESAREINLAWTVNDVLMWEHGIELVLFAPVIETAMIAVPIIFLQRLHVRTSLTVLLVASAMALLHELQAPLWAIHVLLSFIVYCTIFIRRNRPPYRDGFWIAAAVHALGNLVITAGIMIHHYFPNTGL